MTVLKTSLRNFFAHKGRMALSGIAVILSVAFVCGTLVFSDTMTTTFDRLFNETSADVTISAKKVDDRQESGRVQTVPVSLVDKVKKVEGVKAVNLDISTDSITVVDADNEKVGATNGGPTIGANWQNTDRNPVKLDRGRLAEGPGEAVIDADSADKNDVEIGDTLRVVAIPGTFEVKVTGIAGFTVTNPGATFLIFDTATAQEKLLGDPSQTVQIDLDTAAGVSNDELKKNVVAALGDDYKVQTQAEEAEEASDEMGSFLDIFKYAMLGFALISVIVGIFLIVNTFSMLVAQRTREIGLLRAVGASRKQVNRSVLVEATLLGVVGSVLGVGAGVGLAVGLMKLMGMAGMNLSTDDLTVSTTTPVVGLVLGIVVTILAAYLPARRAGKVSPMAALRDAGNPGDRGAGLVRGLVGLLVTGAGIVGLAMAAGEDEASTAGLYLGVGVLFTLVGSIVFGPVLASVVVRVLGFFSLRRMGPIGRMSERNALRNPRRTGATAAALMIGLSLVSALAVVGASMVSSATDELDKSVGADFIVQAEGGAGLLDHQTVEAIRKQEKAGVLEHASRLSFVYAKATFENGATEKTEVNVVDPKFDEDMRVATVAGKMTDAYTGTDTVTVPKDVAEERGVKVGDTVKLHINEGRNATLEVVAISEGDTLFNNGAWYVSAATMDLYLDKEKQPKTAIMLAKAADGQEDQAYETLKKTLEPLPQAEVRNQADFKQELEDQIGSMLNLLYGLLLLAIIVAVLGVVNTLALSVVERTREIGLVRAIGMSRRQTRRMIRMEAVVISIFGAVLGVGLGLAWGITAQKLLALEGLKVLSIPWTTIGVVFVGSAIVGLLAAIVPAYRAGKMNVLNAIATD